MVRGTLAAAALALMLAGPALAEPLDAKAMEDLTAWGSCAAAMGVYEQALKLTKGSDADRALMAKAEEAEARMQTHFDSVANSLDEVQAAEVWRRVSEAMEPRMAAIVGKPDAGDRMLAEFRSDLEACVVRSASLPGPPVLPASPT